MRIHITSTRYVPNSILTQSVSMHVLHGMCINVGQSMTKECFKFLLFLSC